MRKEDDAAYPALLPLPYRSLSSDVQKQLEKAIKQYGQTLSIDETVLMRKKWLSELYAYAVAAEKPALSPWLSGWRKAWIMAEILPILDTVIANNPPSIDHETTAE